MKTILIIATLILSYFYGVSQSFVQQSFNPPTCFGYCDGTIVYTATIATGPFTAVLTNSASCPNSTVQSSSGNSITINNVCACASDYTVSFYNSLNVLVGYEFLQVPITSTAQLTLYTPTVVPSVCSTCCNGEVFVAWSGGYAPPPNNPTVTIDGLNVGSAYFPNNTVCPGSHTLCIKDLANCVVCTTFSMGFVNHVGLNENAGDYQITIAPNPTTDFIEISTASYLPFLNYVLKDLSGKTLLNESMHEYEAKHKMNINTLEPGVYFLEINNSTDKTLLGRKKIIKL